MFKALSSNSCSKSHTDLLTDPMFNPVNVEAVLLLLSTLPMDFICSVSCPLFGSKITKDDVVDIGVEIQLLESPLVGNGSSVSRGPSARNNWASSNMALNTDKSGLVSDSSHSWGSNSLGKGNWGSSIAVSNGWGSVAIVSSIADGWGSGDWGGSNGSWGKSGQRSSNGLNVHIGLSSRVSLTSSIVDVGLSSWGSIVSGVTSSIMDIG